MVKSDEPKHVKSVQLQILASMRVSRCDIYEIHGYGKTAVKGVHKLLTKLKNLVHILNIKTRYREIEIDFIIVKFKRTFGFVEPARNAQQMSKTFANFKQFF